MDNMFFLKSVSCFIFIAVVLVYFCHGKGADKKESVVDKWAGIRPFFSRMYELTENCDPKTFDKVLLAFGNKSVASRQNVARQKFVFTLSLEKDGEIYWIKVAPGRQSFDKITLDQPTERETQDDRLVTTVYSVEGNVLKETQTWHCGQRSGVILRRFTEEEMVVTTQVNDVNCDRVFRFAGMAEPVVPPTQLPPNPEA